jgi:glutathione S-transferase
MKLYYSPGACSLAAHIALRESGLPFQAIAAPTKTHLLPDGTDFRTIQPLGYVPLLELDDGTRLAEVSAILQYIADQAPAASLAPPNGTLARYQLQARLHFVSSELHGKFGFLFNAATPDELKQAIKDRLATRWQWLEGELDGRTWQIGSDFSVADAYLFNVSNWARLVGIDLKPYPRLMALRERVAARPAVQDAMRAEGLIKATA